MFFRAQVCAGEPDFWPFAVLAISVGVIIVLITVLKVHAFMALILAAITAGLLSRTLPGEPEKSRCVQAVELARAEFGVRAGKIGVVIALAAIIGLCLMERGAADKVVRRFIAVFGEKRPGLAILPSRYVLSIPIFFDTFFILLLPMAVAMCLRTGKDYLLYIMAICCGGTVTQSLIAPHPGPLAMAESLKLDLGLTSMVGAVVGIVPTLCSWAVIDWIGRRMTVPLREVPGMSLANYKPGSPPSPALLSAVIGEFNNIIGNKYVFSGARSAGSQRRPLAIQYVQSELQADNRVRLNRLLIEDAFPNALKPTVGMNPTLYTWGVFWGNRNIALLVGAVLALVVLIRQKRGLSLTRIGQRIEGPFATAVVIILITSAGGAFGLMLKNAGAGDAVKALVEGREVNLILLSWLVAAVIRIAQGSATVGVLIMAAMIYPIMAAGTLQYHPVYLFTLPSGY